MFKNGKFGGNDLFDWLRGRNKGVSTYWWQWWVISTQLQLLEFFEAPLEELHKKLGVVPQILVFCGAAYRGATPVWLVFSGAELNFKKQSSPKNKLIIFVLCWR